MKHDWAVMKAQRERLGGAMMIQLLLLASLLLVGTAWAGDGSRILECDISKAPAVCKKGIPEVETTWVYPLGDGQSIDMSAPCHIGDAALTYQDKLIHCYGEKGWRETQMMPTLCELKMQVAMEAIEATWTVSSDSYDGCNHCWEGGCTLLACPNGGNEVARLEWELKRAKEAIARKAKLDQLWTEAKACWRKP